MSKSLFDRITKAIDDAPIEDPQALVQLMQAGLVKVEGALYQMEVSKKISERAKELRESGFGAQSVQQLNYKIFEQFDPDNEGTPHAIKDMKVDQIEVAALALIVAEKTLRGEQGVEPEAPSD